MIKDNKLELDITKVKFANQPVGEPIQISLLSNYGNKQQVSTAFMPTTESAKVLESAEIILSKLSASDQALLDQSRNLKAKGLENLNEQEKSLVDQAQKALAALTKEDRDTLANALKIRQSQTISIRPDDKDKENAGKPLEIKRAKIGPIPSKHNGILATICIAIFIASFSVGPGVCVWLALSELMPTRIRSVGMGIALLIKPRGLNLYCRGLSADGWELRILCHVPLLGRLHGGLFRHRRILPARDQRQDAGGNRGAFRRQKNRFKPAGLRLKTAKP